MRHQRTCWMIILAAICVFSTHGSLAAQSSERILSISDNPISVPTTTTQDFLDGLQLAADAGIRGGLTTKTWSELESTEGSYNIDDLRFGLTFRRNVYDQVLYLGIQPINTNVKDVPADLRDVPFDSPVMRTRFHALLDAVLPLLNENVRYISIGNEVDAYLEQHPDEWATYTAFYEDVVAYLHDKVPTIRVGVTVTFAGSYVHPKEVAALTSLSDVFILTYYPLEGNFYARSPQSPLTDFPIMLKQAGDKPLLLQEVGYPSADSLRSSEAAQAEFMDAAFAAWDAAGNKIPFLNVFLQHDFPDSLSRSLGAYYGMSTNDNLISFLSTLGLRYADGKPKMAWARFVTHAKALKGS